MHCVISHSEISLTRSTRSPTPSRRGLLEPSRRPTARRRPCRKRGRTGVEGFIGRAAEGRSRAASIPPCHPWGSSRFRQRTDGSGPHGASIGQVSSPRAAPHPRRCSASTTPASPRRARAAPPRPTCRAAAEVSALRAGPRRRRAFRRRARARARNVRPWRGRAGRRAPPLRSWRGRRCARGGRAGGRGPDGRSAPGDDEAVVADERHAHGMRDDEADEDEGTWRRRTVAAARDHTGRQWAGGHPCEGPEARPAGGSRVRKTCYFF